MTTRLVWPVERFYWSVLELPGIKRAGALASGSIALLEDDVPVESASLHAVVVPLPGGRVAVCSIEQAALSDVPAEALSLTPAGVPSFLQHDGAEAAHFNLLTGRFEPISVRRRRVRAHACAAAAMMLCAMVIAFGAHRRAVHWQGTAAAAAAQRSALMNEAVASQAPGALAAVNDQLGAVKRVLDSVGKPNDAAVLLSQVLANWPTQVPAKPQSISVSQSGAAISVALEGDPTPFLHAFDVPQGWELDEPRLNTAGSVSRVSLQLRWVGGATDAN